MIQIQQLSLAKQDKPILKDISLQIQKPSIIGLIGPNGAGKTSLLRCIAGLEDFEGQIHLNGQPASNLSAAERAQQVAWVPASTQVPFSYSVRETVQMGRFPWHQGRPKQQDMDRAEAALQSWDLESFADRDVTTLSSGELEKAMICRALVGDCRLLLFDEPCANLDVSSSMHFFALVRQLKEVTTFVTIHDLNMAQRYCDRLILLDHGAMAADGSPEEVLAASTVRQVYGVASEWLLSSDGHRQFVFTE